MRSSACRRRSVVVVAGVVAREVVDRDDELVAHLRPPTSAPTTVEATTTRAGWHKKRSRPFFCSAPGQQAGLGQDLEAVADADHRAAGAGEGRHRLHHRREAGQGARAQVVAVGEAAREHDGVDRAELRVTVPEQRRPAPPAASAACTTSCSQLVPGKTTTPMRGATQIASSSSRLCSITGLASRRSASSVAVVRAAPSSGGVDLEAEGPAGPDVGDAVEAERGQRPLDRGALGVGDPGPQLHLHARPEPHGVAPYQSSSERPVTRS